MKAFMMEFIPEAAAACRRTGQRFREVQAQRERKASLHATAIAMTKDNKLLDSAGIKWVMWACGSLGDRHTRKLLDLAESCQSVSELKKRFNGASEALAFNAGSFTEKE